MIQRTPSLLFATLLIILATAMPGHTRTTLGLIPAFQDIDNTRQGSIGALNDFLTADIGQTVTIRTLSNEQEALRWLTHFQEIDVALISNRFLHQQPAGALVPLAGIYIGKNESPSLMLVTRPGLSQALQDRWRATFLNLQKNPDSRRAFADIGVLSTAQESKTEPPENKAVIKEKDQSTSVQKQQAAPTSQLAAQAPRITSKVETPQPEVESIEEKTEVSNKSAVNQDTTSEPETSVSAPSTPLKQTKVLTAIAGTDTSTEEGLSLTGFVQQVISQNHRIKGEKAQFDIQMADEEKTHAIFEPDFITSLQLDDNSQRNTAEESLSRLLSSVYEEKNWDYSASLQGLLPTGAYYNLGFNYRDLSNTVNGGLTGDGTENQMYLGISLTQPLLKNAGIETTNAGIRTAEAETRASFHDYRQKLMKTAREATIVYWEYYQALKKLTLREDSVRIANAILEDNRERLKTGKMSNTEVLEAMAGVASRKSLVSEARHEKKKTENHMRSLLSLSPGVDGRPLEVIHTNDLSLPVLNQEARVQKATTLRPDYLAALERLNQADIKIAFAENQHWPELDLKASYGLNGLALSSGDAWDQVADAEYDSWGVGLELTLPILGGIDTRSDLKRNQLEKKSQLWELKDIEINLANEIDSAIDLVSSAAQQLDHSKNIVDLNKRLLETEKARLKAGRSHSRQLLEKEDNYRVAMEESLENLVQLKIALTELELAEGSILQNNGVEIMGREQ